MSNFNTMQHLFFAIEGPEAAGKGTQIILLKEDLEKLGISVHTTFEPTSGPIGKLIKQALRGEFLLTQESLQTLFTADRIQHQKEILENLKNGHVITDRYFGSTLSYIHTINIDSKFLDALTRLNLLQKVPDVWIYLRCTVEESIASIAKRNDAPEIFDKREKLEQILLAYDKFFESQNNVIIINRNGMNIDEVHNEIILKLKKINIL